MWLLCGIQTTQKLFATFRNLIQRINIIAGWFTGIVSGLAHPSSLSSVSRVSPGMAGVNQPTGNSWRNSRCGLLGGPCVTRDISGATNMVVS